VQQQAVAIAESYLEEILLLPVTDPDGSNAGESRSTFDNINDYNGLSDTGARDQSGNAITNLSNYNVSVATNNASVSGVTMTAVTVTVTRTNTTLSLTGYRASY
jgi:MSHA pilin protein MshD